MHLPLTLLSDVHVVDSLRVLPIDTLGDDDATLLDTLDPKTVTLAAPVVGPFDAMMLDDVGEPKLIHDVVDPLCIPVVIPIVLNLRCIDTGFVLIELSDVHRDDSELVLPILTLLDASTNALP